MTFIQDLSDYILSGHPIIVIKTHEKMRAVEDIVKCCEDIKRTPIVWCVSSGLFDAKGLPIDANMRDPEECLKKICTAEEGSVFILKDFDFYMTQGTYSAYDVILSWLQELLPVLSNSQKTIVILCPSFTIPEVLKHDITILDFSLPKDEHIEKLINFVAEGVERSDGEKFVVDNDTMTELVPSCRGMSQNQIIDRVSLAIRKHKRLDKDAIRTILTEKSNIIKSSNLLSYHETFEGGLSLVGGYDLIKRHIILDKPCFSKEALEFGIDSPKGILLVGIPGCGKTLLTKAIASELDLPLIAMDVANLMDSLVGGSEANMRQALMLLESIAPCVLQLDEIEKGFGGTGDLDGGSSRRVFGQFLKWLSDKNNSVYVVATANNIQSLPSEFLRKGRFDEVFALDLPQEDERVEIFKIHIMKKNRDPKDFDLLRLAKQSADFSGADIEQVVKYGLKLAFAQKSGLCDVVLETGIKEIVPLAKLEPNRINDLRQWIKTHGKCASSIRQIDTKRCVKL